MSPIISTIQTQCKCRSKSKPIRISSSNSNRSSPSFNTNTKSNVNANIKYTLMMATWTITMVLISNLPSAESFSIQSSSFGIQASNARTSTRISAATLDSPPSSSEMSPFQKRMLERMNPTTKKKPLVRNKNIPENLMNIETLEEYKNIVGGNKDKLIVVRFYAPWCKACKAIAPAFYRLASTYKTALFIDVPVTAENANLHQGLGVTSLPFGHIYHPTGGLVEEIKISKKFFPNFARVLKSYVNGLCDVGEYEESEEKNSENMSETVNLSSKKP